jgi:hypothetical protein
MNLTREQAVSDAKFQAVASHYWAAVGKVYRRRILRTEYCQYGWIVLQPDRSDNVPLNVTFVPEVLISPDGREFTAADASQTLERR